MGNHEIVRVLLDESYPYSDFMGWYNNLDANEKDVWLHIVKSTDRTEQNTMLIGKKAMELYCLEMDVDFIPNSEEYLEKIFNKLTSNLILASLVDKGLVNINSGSLSLIGEADLSITERGKKFLPKKA
jgi:hypothetical protein